VLDRWVSDGYAGIVFLAVAHDASRIGIATKLLDTVIVWEVSPQRVARLAEQERVDPPEECVSGDDTTIAQYSVSEFAEQWRWSNADLATMLGRGGLGALAVGSEQVLAGTSSGQLVPLIPRSKDIPRIRRAPSGVTSIALSAEETQSFIGTANGDVLRLRLPEGTQLEKLGSHSGSVTSVVLIERQGLVATSSRDKTIQLWRQRQNQFVRVLTLRAAGPIDRLRATADGSRLIAHIQGEPALRVWRLDLLRERLQEMNLNW
jgi:WD40 repeat protein